jgi:hypothetical protein
MASSSVVRRYGVSGSAYSSSMTDAPTNLLTAIEDHASNGSEANQVISAFNMLSTSDQQNVLNFLRSL